MVQEKFLIPEEIPATERTAFHGAAAAAHKAGKSHFSFAGKKHPVTMKKDTANAIADQNEATVVNTKKMDAYKKHIKSKMVDHDSVRFAAANPNTPEAQRMHKMKHFSTAVKMHKAAMKEDTANAIADQKEGYYKDMEIKKQDKAMGAKPVPSKKKKEAKGGGKEGDVEMNPKMEKDSKSTRVESVDYHKKMANSHGHHSNAHDSEANNGGHDDHDYASVDHHEAEKAHNAAAAAHKKHGGDSSQYKSASAKAKSASKEAKEASENAGKFKKTAPPKPMGESKIRSALRSVLSEKSRDDHYKSSTDPEMMKDKIKGKGAEDMMKGADDEIAKGPDAHLDEPAMVNKDAAKMTSNVPKGKARGNDNMKGDTKIKPGGTPMKNPAAMKAESFGSQVSNISAAYAAMQPIEIDELDESMLGHKGASAANGGKSLDPRFKSSASHIDYHHRRSDGHTKSGGDEDQHRYQVAKKLGYKV